MAPLKSFLTAAGLLICLAAVLPAQTVRFTTNLGNIDVTLSPDAAPLTVANFLNYMNRGSYNNSIFHRSVTGFIIQGGGFQLIDHTLVAIPADPAVTNEFKLSNTRGTIAMAKLDGDPNSATSQWFFNLANNSANLDAQNGGFTVFGHVANSASLQVMDKIGALPADANGLPLYDYTGTVDDHNFVLVSSIAQLPVVTAGGVLSAASYASNGTTGISPGELITIFGTGLGPATLKTLALDASGLAVTSLAGTRVLFNGTAGAMVYTSANQISVVAPYNLAGKSSVNVVVEYQGVQTAATTFKVAAANPGIFTLDGSGKGDSAIIRQDGSIVNTANPAAPGDVLTLYGEGYGAQSPALPDGAIIGSTLPLPISKTTLLIDGQPLDPLYAGGAPAIVNGVLQVNFIVPQLSAGSHQIQVQVGMAASPAGTTLQTK